MNSFGNPTSDASASWDDKALLLDVRSPGEYASGHVDGAVNLPLDRFVDNYAALAPDKPVLEDFVAGIPVEEQNPVDACQISVSLTLQGVAAGPAIMPTPRPDLPGDPPNQNLFP